MPVVRTLALLLTLCLLSVGCAGRYDLQEPSAKLQEAKLGEVTPEGFTVNFLVDVQNPNPIHLPLSYLRYDLDVGGVGILNKQRVELTEGVPARGSAVVAVPVAVRFDDLLKARQAIADAGGDVPYTFTGSLDFTGASFFSDLAVPINYRGVIPMRQILNDPQALLQSPAARKLATDALGNILSP